VSYHELSDGYKQWLKERGEQKLTSLSPGAQKVAIELQKIFAEQVKK
jgi:hypothetical protein